LGEVCEMDSSVNDVVASPFTFELKEIKEEEEATIKVPVKEEVPIQPEEEPPEEEESNDNEKGKEKAENEDDEEDKEEEDIKKDTRKEQDKSTTSQKEPQSPAQKIPDQPPMKALTPEQITVVFDRLPEDSRLIIPADPDEGAELEEAFPDRKKTVQRPNANNMRVEMQFPPPPTPPKTEKERQEELKQQQKEEEERRKRAWKRLEIQNKMAFMDEAERKKMEEKLAKEDEALKRKQDIENQKKQDIIDEQVNKREADLQSKLEEAKKICAKIKGFPTETLLSTGSGLLKSGNLWEGAFKQRSGTKVFVILLNHFAT